MTTDYLLNSEIDKILSLLTEGNALVLRVAIHTGLRVSDILSIKTEQLKPHFWVNEKKTGKSRQIGLPEPLLSDIKKQAGKVWAFPGKNRNKPRTRQAVWKDIKRASLAYRLPQNIGIHSARKVYAVDLLRKYGDIEKVRRALNHSSPAVTLIYALADMQLLSKKQRKRKSSGRPLV